MKATHVVIEDVGHFLKAGEKVYIIASGEFEARVQSVNPSYKEGRWFSRLENLRPIRNLKMENK